MLTCPQARIESMSLFDLASEPKADALLIQSVQEPQQREGSTGG